MLKWTAVLYRVFTAQYTKELLDTGARPLTVEVLTDNGWEEVEVPLDSVWVEDKNYMGQETKGLKTFTYYFGEPDPIVGEEEAEKFREMPEPEKNMNKRFDGTRFPKFPNRK